VNTVAARAPVPITGVDAPNAWPPIVVAAHQSHPEAEEQDVGGRCGKSLFLKNGIHNLKSHYGQ
jgi:hypothetical protein